MGEIIESSQTETEITITFHWHGHAKLFMIMRSKCHRTTHTHTHASEIGRFYSKVFASKVLSAKLNLVLSFWNHFK